MITVGSVDREEAAIDFSFLAKNFRGRRKAIKEFNSPFLQTMYFGYIQMVSFSMPETRIRSINQKGSSIYWKMSLIIVVFYVVGLPANYGSQLIVVYCREEALASE